MAVAGRLDAVQQRHPGLGVPIAVVYKFVDDQGSYLAALITYYGFLSLFPLLLLAVTVLGFVLSHDPGLRDDILGSALSNFPVVGSTLRENVAAFHGSGVGLGFGIAGSLYGGLGVAQAGQNAMNQIWAVPRAHRPNPFTARIRSLLLVLLLGAGVLVTTALSALFTGAESFAHDLADVGVGLRIAAVVVAVLLNVGLFTTAFRLLTSAAVTVRDVLPGAVVAAVLWQVLQSIGTYYLGHQVSGATEAYGVFALVLGIIAWIYLEAVVVVLCAEFNSVLRQRLWPRALLTPFTDDVTLTTADETVYEGLAASQQAKGFETVEVRFDPPAEQAEP